jgi:PPM family protein phosphatase
MKINASGLSDVGLQRDHNEDSYAIVAEFNLYIVADGMGGHRAGDVASKMAVEGVGDFFRQTENEDATWPFSFDTDMSEEENRLVSGIRLANRQIFDKGIRSREHSGMGTTAVTALYSKRKKSLYVAHVGDSRAYRIRRGGIVQLTRDHSLLNDYLAAIPDLTEEQQAEVPRNVITRALGMQDTVSVDILRDAPQIGDVYVLCTDGLSSMLADQDILDIASVTLDPQEICRRLIEEANDQGGEDNITAVVILFEPAQEEKEEGNARADSDLEEDLSPEHDIEGCPVHDQDHGAHDERLIGSAGPGEGPVTEIPHEAPGEQPLGELRQDVCEERVGPEDAERVSPPLLAQHVHDDEEPRQK